MTEKSDVSRSQKGMKIIGLGVDIVEISRVERLMRETPRFLERVFGPEEIARIKRSKSPARHAAARFAAKEAVAKAIGTGVRGFSFKDIVVLNDASGRPYVELRDAAREVAALAGVSEVAISLSFSRDNAVASAVAIGDGSGQESGRPSRIIQL